MASLAIYFFAFVRPYGLLEWWSHPGLTIAKIAHNDPRSGALFVVSFLVLFLFSWIGSHLVLGEHRAVLWSIVVVGAIAFNVAMLFLYPVDAVDVFENVIRGRMQAYYHANPFYQTPSSFPNDPFYRYTIWHTDPSAYGPVWEDIAALTAQLAGNGIIANALAFKAVGILAYAGTALFIGLALRRVAPERAMYGVTLFAWNPMVIYAVAGNGHNDSVMTFFIALGFYFLARGNPTFAALAETAGALVKFIPALLVPVILVAVLKQNRNWTERILRGGITILACAIVVVVAYAPYWHGGDILGADRRARLFTTSLATLAQVTLAQKLGANASAVFVSRLAFFLLGVCVVQRLWDIWSGAQEEESATVTRQLDFQRFTHAALMILLFYLLISILWFQPWYVVWPMTLAALLPDGMLLRTTFVFTLAATWKMPAFDYVIGMRPGNVPPVFTREWQATAMTLGVPWITFLYQYLSKKQDRQKQIRIPQ